MNSIGIVIGGQRTLSANTLAFADSPHPADLRRYALYWDRIHYAYLSRIWHNYERVAGTEHLVAEGVLELVPMDVDPAMFAANNTLNMLIDGYSPWQLLKAERRAQLLLQIRNNEAGGNWSIAQTGERLDLGVEVGTPSPKCTLLELSLNSCIPQPREDSKMEDILKFKNKRTSEFRAFRGAVENLCTQVDKTEDRAAGLSKAQDELGIALRDLTQVMTESFAITFVKNFKAYIQSPGISSLAATLVGGVATHFNPWITLASYIAGGTISSAATVKNSRLAGVPMDLRPYLYLFSAQSELNETA